MVNIKKKLEYKKLSVPDAPANIKVVVSTSQSLFISWLPPNHPNGIITKYTLYTRVVNGREELNHEKKNVPSQQFYHEVKNLQAHIEYQFWVTASTRIGEGKSSRVVSQITSNRVPARIVSFGGPIIQPWRSSIQLFCNAVGKPRREWYKGDINLKQLLSHNVQIQDNGNVLISSLQISDTGNYTCQVDNGIGTDRLIYNLIVQVPPGAPVLYVTSATSHSILMHWKTTSTGNAPITKYTLHYKRTHGNLEELPLSRHTTSHELKGLLCGSTYQVFLTVHNKIGTSPASTTLHVRTQGQSPGTPIANSLIAPNSTSATFRLNAWPDNGCPIEFFVLQYRTLSENSNNEWILVSNALKPQKRFTISGLTPSTLYQVKMEAHNVAGTSNIDMRFATLTKDGQPPPADLIRRDQKASLFDRNFNLLIPVIAALSGIVFSIAFFIICYKQSKCFAVFICSNALKSVFRFFFILHRLNGNSLQFLFYFS